MWLNEASLSYRPAYQLRHTYASRMLMAGANPAWLAQQMGHKNWDMISAVYAKWIPGQDPNYINKLADKLGQISC
ncbi:tyrosine-type recombinase/integrase [Thalassotalea ponticola]|uniref:tyrosine-type recombinase/integrase n=1 Tax=Thalassotalea ponticola TaxID=1523392 RepID=UPI0025B532F0|nr:tyrosine-type recombinase/integrase [Thalassotalea ponticola]MDN3651371.1 tyrosine-type recombinase/integrase [Thalassotalea ponticola]